MYHAKYIIPALIVFVAVVTFPFWAKGKAAYRVDLKLPANQTECIEATEFMRTSHMQLLDQWRDKVVRDGEHVYTNAKGVKYSMSLTKTCLSCHSEKDKFCDKCHNSVGVDPYCWNCHLTTPKGGK
jgi:cytochrome c peroxidase